MSKKWANDFFTTEITQRTHLPRAHLPGEFFKGFLRDLRVFSGETLRQPHEISHSILEFDNWILISL